MGNVSSWTLAFWWWCRGVGNLIGMENCSRSRQCTLCVGSCTLPMGGSPYWISLSQLENEKENWIKRKVTLSRILRIPQWDNISKSCNPGVQSRMENMTWILPACLLPWSMNEGVNAEIGCPWVVTCQLTTFLGSLHSLASHVHYYVYWFYSFSYIKPPLTSQLICIFHKMIFPPKLQPVI